MSEFAIQVKNLSKLYRIGERERHYRTLRDTVTNVFAEPFRQRSTGSNDHMKTANDRLASDRIWALKDICMDVRRGEVVGVIGRNGAGKSTLLKVLSRITEPTEGYADIHGRVGSLLEVGTGFHPELTGRENIYLNGAILGMRRAEIKAKFDEIVAFAEIDRFIDTPVKRYSSGMYLRLAFAVAAHLDPEILVVDEVLAVGDAAFQKKCLGKIGDVVREGRTVVFVSHNMGAVSHLCRTAIVLDRGQVVYQGEAHAGVEFYNQQLIAPADSARTLPPYVIYDRPENGQQHDFAITRIEVFDAAGLPKSVVATWDTVVFRIWYSCKRFIRRGSVVLELATFDGTTILLMSTEPDGTVPMSLEIGERYVECVVNSIPFAAGEYLLGGGLAIPQVEWLWRQQQLTKLTIAPRDVYNSGLAPKASRSLVATRHNWRVVQN